MNRPAINFDSSMWTNSAFAKMQSNAAKRIKILFDIVVGKGRKRRWPMHGWILATSFIQFVNIIAPDVPFPENIDFQLSFRWHIAILFCEGQKHLLSRLNAFGTFALFDAKTRLLTPKMAFEKC